MIAVLSTDVFRDTIHQQFCDPLDDVNLAESPGSCVQVTSPSFLVLMLSIQP